MWFGEEREWGDVLPLLATYILRPIKCTPTQTSKEFRKYFRYVTNLTFPTGMYAPIGCTTICPTYIVHSYYIHTVHYLFAVCNHTRRIAVCILFQKFILNACACRSEGSRHACCILYVACALHVLYTCSGSIW